MRQTTFKPIAFIALNTEGTVEEERQILKDHNLHANKPLSGVYKGQEENIFLVCISTPEDKEAVLTVARKFNQESVLFSGIDRTCTLHYLEDDREQVVGVLTAVPEDFAKERESYTFDPASGTYWVAL